MPDTKITAFVLGIRNNFRGEDLVIKLKELGIKVTVIFGPTLGNNLELLTGLANQEFAKFVIKRIIKLEEVACCLGHIEMYKAASCTESDWSLFLEDDAILKRNPSDFLSSLEVIDFPVLVFLHDGLGNNVTRLRIKSKIRFQKIKLRRWLDPKYSTYGYALNKEAIRVILNSKSSSLISSADWPYSWPTSIRYFSSPEVYFSHPDDLSQSIIGERVTQANSIRNQVPSIVRFWKAIRLGINPKIAFQREIRFKTQRLFFQIVMKLRKMVRSQS